MEIYSFIFIAHKMQQLFFSASMQRTEYYSRFPKITTDNANIRMSQLTYNNIFLPYSLIVKPLQIKQIKILKACPMGSKSDF